jgi:hypothetical protein
MNRAFEPPPELVPPASQQSSSLAALSGQAGGQSFDAVLSKSESARPRGRLDVRVSTPNWSRITAWATDFTPEHLVWGQRYVANNPLVNI